MNFEVAGIYLGRGPVIAKGLLEQPVEEEVIKYSNIGHSQEVSW